MRAYTAPQGPYRMGMRDYAFKGKISYRFCRKPAFPPSGWDGSLAVRSGKKPKVGRELRGWFGRSVG